MHILHTVAEMQTEAKRLLAGGASIGCIPTMGALHSGHASLITASSAAHTASVVSIFVNPTQFGANEDYSRYPRTLQADIALAADHGATHVFAPSAEEMYPQNHGTTITVSPLSTILEGAYRPGHFDGVATIVCKLFAAMLPTAAYFGSKDFQQTLVVKQMVRDLNLPIVIRVMPTVRESDGLALSSRNRYLAPDHRSSAVALYHALLAGAKIWEGGSGLRTEIEAAMLAVLREFDVDYAVAATADTLEMPSVFDKGSEVVLLVAARVGSTRLIDSMVLRSGL